MTVQELIGKLSEMDQTTDVQFVVSIESGRSLSICDDVDFVDIEQDVDKTIIVVQGEETDYQ